MITSIDVDSFHFEEDGHQYVHAGRNHPSVTGLLKKHGLIDYSMVSHETLMRKRDIGLRLHKWTEVHDRTGVADFMILPEENVGYAKAWLNFLRQSGFEIIDIEFRMMSEIMGMMVGGTSDRHFRYRKSQDLIADLKFCAQPMPAWGPQTAAYTMMRFKKLHIGNTLRCSIQLFPDGRFQIHWYDQESDGDAFLAIVSLEAWKWNHNLRGSSQWLPVG